MGWTGWTRLRGGIVRRCLPLLAVAACALVPIEAQAQTRPWVESVIVLDAGIYDVTIAKKTKRAEQRRHTISQARLAQATRLVPLRRCVSFGFEYVIKGASAGANVSLRMVTRFPQPGLRNEKTGHAAQAAEATLERVVGQRHYWMYTLDEENELLPGRWVFEIWDRERKLAEQRFDLGGTGEQQTHACSYETSQVASDRAADANSGWRGAQGRLDTARD